MDRSNIHYEAYLRIGDVAGCLRVLRECLLTVEEDTSRAILHFKIAQLEDKLSNRAASVENHHKALKLWPGFFEPMECLLSMAIDARDWNQVSKLIINLAHAVHDDFLKDRLFEAGRRLEESRTLSIANKF